MTAASDSLTPTIRHLLIRARVVVPINRPPIADGAVAIRGDRILAVGRWRNLRSHHTSEVCDLGEVALLPGLINAHCHLDYTHMAGVFPPQKSFCDWIKLITTEKGRWTDSEFIQSWADGAKMLLESGTTTVGDIEAIPEILPKVWEQTPLRVISFLEMTGVRSRRKPTAILHEALDKIGSLPPHRCTAALSPHAPYSTTSRLLQRAASAARKDKLRLAIHVAESATEFEMFTQARGEMFDWLSRNQREMSDCGGVSPVQHLAQNRALGRHLLAVHVNYLADGDAPLLARHKVSVIHCPRSHAYFRHGEFPLHKLTRAGVNICLGTDSLATMEIKRRQTPALDLFAEMRAFATKYADVLPATILRMVTMNAAHALGLQGNIGELKRYAAADLIALPFSGKSTDIHTAILQHTGRVTASMIAGDWAIAPQ
jgi:cytosine/adenosine deaminase-related metal-dependent hydrolase